MAATLDETLLAAAQPQVPLFDRELSWLQFNRRVLGEAENPAVPLLERVKFLAIASRNLDEFLMIRVGEVRDLIAAGDQRQVAKLEAIREEIRRLLDEMYRCLEELAKEGILVRTYQVGRACPPGVAIEIACFPANITRKDADFSFEIR